MDDTQIIARVSATPARRVIGVGTLAALGALLLWLLVAEPPAEIYWQAVLLLLGVAALWIATFLQPRVLGNDLGPIPSEHRVLLMPLQTPAAWIASAALTIRFTNTCCSSMRSPSTRVPSRASSVLSPLKCLCLSKKARS